MAKKKYTPKNGTDDGLRPDERVAQKFAEQLIEKLEGAKLDWKKPWFSNVGIGAPQNFDGRRYNGMNQMFLALKQEEMGYQLPVWITFQHAKKLGVNVNKGEKSMTVWLGSRIIFDSEGKKISAGKYNDLSDDEKKQCSVRPFAKAFTVFNIQQTNYPELYPEAYSALKEKMMVRSVHDDTGMLQVRELDDMILNRTWVCPINPKEQDNAYYSISKDEIVVPLKGQFIDGESFYKTLLHEMAHSTGAESRLNRLHENGQPFGSQGYAREELVAEMTAAIVANTMGFSSGIKEDSVAYLQSWLSSLKESPKFMLTVMKDVNKACAMVESYVYNKAAKLNIEDEMEQQVVDVEAEEVDDAQTVQVTPQQVEMTEDAEVSVDKPVQQMAVPENRSGYRVEQETDVPAYGQQNSEPKLHKAYLGNGITLWEDGDTEYTGHISPDRKVSFDKDFSPSNRQTVERLAEFGNMIYGNDDKSRRLVLEPLGMATHLLPNSMTGELYPVSREQLDPDRPETAVYCTGQYLLADDVQDRLVELKYPREYVFSITGLDRVRPVLYKLARQGVDVSEMQDMLEMVDDIIGHKTLERNEIEDKVLYFLVRDNKIEKFNRMADELGSDLPRYWFKDNMLRYNHPGREAARTQSDAQILAGGEAVIRLTGSGNFLPALQSLAEKGVSILPKLEAEIKVMADVTANHNPGLRDKDTLYLFVRDGVVVDTEPRINEKDYDLPKYVYEGGDFKRWNGLQQTVETKEDWSYVVYHFQVENRLVTEAGGRFTDNEKDAQRMYNEMSAADNNNQNVTLMVHISPALKNQLMKPLTEQELMEIMNSNRSDRKVLRSSKNITHQLNKDNMENKQETKKEMKDGLYLFPMKSGNWGINEVKNGEPTPTIVVDKADVDNFVAVTKGQKKDVRDAEVKKLAEKYLTPENIAAALERKAKREQEAAAGEKKDSNYIRIPEVKPEVRERIANARPFKMQDNKTWAISADIDGAHISKPMGEKLQNSFLAKLGAINKGDGEAKGQSTEAKAAKAELYMNTAAMTFHKELSAPKQEQGQSAGMKR